MKMHPVESSNVAAIGHENETMHVQFRHGGTYAYQGVTAEGFKKLSEAPSIGGFLNKMNVKGVKLPEEVKTSGSAL